MDFAALAVVASVSLGQVHVGGQCVGDDCFLATPAPYPMMTDSVNRPGYNGRLYVRRPVIGGVESYASCATNKTDRYGAYGSEHAVAWARVGHQPIRLDPFTELPAGMRHQNAARQVWLRQQGFVGGVRTHVNDAYLIEEVAEVAARPTPRATIKVPADWRRSPTLQVRHDARPVVSMYEVAASDVDLRPVVRYEPSGDETVADAR